MDITFDREMRKKVQDFKKLDNELNNLRYSRGSAKRDARLALLDSKRLELERIATDLVLELYDHIGEEEE